MPNYGNWVTFCAEVLTKFGLNCVPVFRSEPSSYENTLHMVYFVTSARPNPILIHWSFPWPCGNIKYCEVTSCCDEGITSRYHRADFPVARVCFLAHLILLFFISLYFPWRFNIGCFDILNIIHHVILMFLSHFCRNLFYFCHHSHKIKFMLVNYDSTNFCVLFVKDAQILYRAVYIPLPAC